MDLLLILLTFLAVTSLSKGQNEICQFYNLHADCRYRVDTICLSHIRAVIDQCADPIQVKFIITCQRPRVDFSHTFSTSDSIVSVLGFDMQVQLRVRLRMKDDDVLNVEADFHVGGHSKADFINSDIKLRGLEEDCPALNNAAKIAIGVMGGLVVITGAMIVMLVFVARRRRKNAALQSVNNLVENEESPAYSSSQHLESVSEVTEQETPSSVHSGSYLGGEAESVGNPQVVNKENGVEASEGQGTDGGYASGKPDMDPVAEGSSTSSKLDPSDVRFSDILRAQNQGQLKISDC